MSSPFSGKERYSYSLSIRNKRLIITAYNTELMSLRSKHIKDPKERSLLGQDKISKFSRKSLLSNYKTTLKQQLNGQKRFKTNK